MDKIKVPNYKKYYHCDCKYWNPNTSLCSKHPEKGKIKFQQCACKDFFWESDTLKYKKEINNWKNMNNNISAQQRADRKYKAKLESINLRFRPQDILLYNHLKQQPNMTQFLKNLILKDIKSCKNNKKRKRT